jgi:hypothetical protein
MCTLATLTRLWTYSGLRSKLFSKSALAPGVSPTMNLEVREERVSDKKVSIR